MRNRLLTITRGGIPYIKELRIKTKSVTSSIVMQQLDFWFNTKNGDSFYKFLEPAPNHSGYKEGDSWTEELGFSAEEFQTAFKQIGIAYKSKKEFDQADNKFIVKVKNKNGELVEEEKFYCSYYDRLSRLTYYFRNHTLVDDFLESVTRAEYSPRHQTGNVGFSETKHPASRNRQSQFLETDNPGLAKPTTPDSFKENKDSEITTKTTTKNTHTEESESEFVGSDNVSFSQGKGNKKQTEQEQASLSANVPTFPKTNVVGLVAASQQKRESDIKTIFSYWKEKISIPDACLMSKGDDYWKVIEARLNEGLRVEQLKTAIDGCSRDPFSMGLNDRGRAFNCLTVIFKSKAKVWEFINLVEQVTNPSSAALAAISKAKAKPEVKSLEQIALEAPSITDNRSLYEIAKERTALEEANKNKHKE